LESKQKFIETMTKMQLFLGGNVDGLRFVFSAFVGDVLGLDVIIGLAVGVVALAALAARWRNLTIII
jgi:hypothetical protein